MPAVIAAALERRRHRGLDVVVGRLEPEHEQRVRAVAGAGHLRLARRRSAGSSSGTGPDCDSARTASAPAANSANRTAAEARRGRARPDPDPRLGDHAERPLGADQHPVGRDAGARARQPPRLPHAARRERPHRLDEVVDVRVERREVAAGARGDPAAERRELKRLREVAQRQPVLAELLLEPRAGRAGLDPRRSETGSTSSTRSSALRSIVTTPAKPLAARPPRRRRRRSCRRRTGSPPRRADSAHSSVGLDLGLGARARDDVRRVVEAPAERAHDVAVGAAVGVQRALVVARSSRSRERAGRSAAGARAARRPTAAPAARARSSRSRAAPPRNRGRVAQLRRARAARPRSPSPSA